VSWSPLIRATTQAALGKAKPDVGCTAKGFLFSRQPRDKLGTGGQEAAGSKKFEDI